MPAAAATSFWFRRRSSRKARSLSPNVIAESPVPPSTIGCSCMSTHFLSAFCLCAVIFVTLPGPDVICAIHAGLPDRRDRLHQRPPAARLPGARPPDHMPGARRERAAEWRWERERMLFSIKNRLAPTLLLVLGLAPASFLIRTALSLPWHLTPQPALARHVALALSVILASAGLLQVTFSLLS